ncbi:MAG TPA: NAD-binding protein [Acidimicrobiales bacterium]|nr:NAD-binding protein [Acidimicrobiales bacterium]
MEAPTGMGMRDHVIVCGLQGVGLRAVEQFHLSGTPVVVIDDDADPRFARILEEWGVPHIRKNAYFGDALHEADLDAALAVVCVEINEIHTLETALRIREIRPDVRMVVQLANPAVARALERVSGDGSVLDVATLAGPSFVEACLRRNSHRIELAGVRFEVVQVEVPEADIAHPTFRGHFGNLAPVAIMPADGGEMAQCPGRDHRVVAGDRVAVLGTAKDLELGGIGPGQIPRSPLRTVAITRRIARQVSVIMEEGNKALVLVVASLVALIAVSTVILRFAYRTPGAHGHLDALSAAYFTLETVATVGYGDYTFATQDPLMRVFGIALIAIGVALVSTAFALFTNILVSRRIERSLGRREVPGMVDHIVVVGLGSVGIAVVEGLIAEGQRVVVVERDDDNRYLAQARALGVPVVIADATQIQTHRMVNLGDASAVAVLTSADLTNIETGLAIRESLGERWEEVPVVLRVFDRDLARLMEQSFGFRHVRSTSALAAPWFVGAALGLDVLSTFYVDQQPFLVGRVTVAPQGGLQGLAMADLSARTRVIALSRAAEGGQLEHPPRRGTRFAGGDQAYLLGPYEELLRVLRRDQTTTA